MMIDCISETPEKLFVTYGTFGYMSFWGKFLITLFYHFITKEPSVDSFIHFMCRTKLILKPKIGLGTALVLLSTHIVFSTENNLILSTSKCIDIWMLKENRKSYVTVMSHYIKTFELSVVFNISYMSTNFIDNFIEGGDQSSWCLKIYLLVLVSHHSYVIWLNNHNDKLVEFYHQHFQDVM